MSFAKTAQHFRDPWPPELVARADQSAAPENPNFLLYAKAIHDAHDAFVVATDDKNTSNIDAAVKNLDAAPSLDPKADQLRRRLKALLLRAKETQPLAAASPTRDKNKPAPVDQLKLDFSAWEKEYNQWLNTDGRNHNGLNKPIEDSTPT